MTVYFVTSNEGKVRNAQKSLARFGISVKQVALDLAESRSEDPAVIALEKARQAFRKFQKPIIVEDSGFFIEALGGFPMTHVKFSLKTLGIKYILKMMRGVKNRRVEWRMTLAYVSGKSRFKTFTYIERGEIATRLSPVKRAMMSDYWRIYIPKMIPGNTHALSEMSANNLRVWQEYYKTHIHYMMFGRWLTQQKEL